MLRQVEIAAVVNPLQLAPAKGELVLDIEGGAGVVRQFLGAVLVQPQVLPSDAEAEIPVEARLSPILEPLRSGLGFDKELHLHLLELAGAKDEVSRGDFVAERLADLSDAERDFLARWQQHVAKVDVD